MARFYDNKAETKWRTALRSQNRQREASTRGYDPRIHDIYVGDLRITPGNKGRHYVYDENGVMNPWGTKEKDVIKMILDKEK